MSLNRTPGLGEAAPQSARAGSHLLPEAGGVVCPKQWTRSERRGSSGTVRVLLPEDAARGCPLLAETFLTAQYFFTFTLSSPSMAVGELLEQRMKEGQKSLGESFICYTWIDNPCMLEAAGSSG